MNPDKSVQYSRHDPIISVAGDLPNGVYENDSTAPSMFTDRKSKRKIEIYKENIKGVEVLDTEKQKKLLGTAGWGLAGAVALGPLGAVGGMLIGGNKKQVTFACYFEDGKKIMAETDSATMKYIQQRLF